jgi:hypothetical protein
VASVLDEYLSNPQWAYPAVCLLEMTTISQDVPGVRAARAVSGAPILLPSGRLMSRITAGSVPISVWREGNPHRQTSELHRAV